MCSISLDACRGYINAHSQLAPGKTRRELPVVTISREAGAGAGTLAPLLAELLNQRNPKKDGCPWTVFNRNLVEKVLEDHQLPTAIQQFMPEDATVFSPGSVVEELLGLHPANWTLVQHTTDTILRLARMGNVILVGRGANVISARCKKAFHVRLVAPIKLRIERAAKRYQLTEREAAVLIRQKDAARRRYVKANFKIAIDDPLQYHATINTGLISFETAAQLIAEAVSINNQA